MILGKSASDWRKQEAELELCRSAYLEQLNNIDSLNKQIVDLVMTVEIQSNSIETLVDENRKLKTELRKTKHMKEALEARFNQLSELPDVLLVKSE